MTLIADLVKFTLGKFKAAVYTPLIGEIGAW
jgi:hypothetical protein